MTIPKDIKKLSRKKESNYTQDDIENYIFYLEEEIKKLKVVLKHLYYLRKKYEKHN